MSATLQEAAARCGGHCWVERRLFEVLGSWAGEAASAEAALTLDRHSLHAAWRAQQWWDRLPVLAGVDRADLVVAPPGWDALFATAPVGDVARLAVAYRVALPRLLSVYRRHRADAVGPADGPVLRTLEQVRSDARGDADEGESVLERLLLDAGTVGEAAAAARDAESALVAGERPPGAAR